MNIKHENVPGLVQEVIFEINTEDYAEALETALKKQRRSAQIPGFRSGNAPMGLVKKMYEKTIMVNEIDRILNTNMSKFMEDNNIKYIFEPLPIESKSQVNFDNPGHFEFAYEYALAPEVNIDFDKLPSINDFQLVPDDKQCTDYIDQLRERHGEYMTPDSIENNDSISVEYGDGKDGFFFIRDLKEEEQSKFVGKKNGDVVAISLKNAFTAPYLLARFLKIKDSEILPDNDYSYDFTIKHIGRITPANLDADFFHKAFPDGSVSNEQELNQAAAKHIAEEWKNDLDKQFMNDAITMLLDNVTVDMPVDFVKHYILSTHKEYTEDKLNEQLDELMKSFKWQMIENKLASEGNIHVEQDAIKDYFRQYFIKNYFGNFNPNDVQQRIDELVQQSMQNQENVKSVYDLLFDEQFSNYLRSVLKINTQEGSSKDYIEMMTSKYSVKDTEKKEDASDTDKKTTKRKPAAKKSAKTDETEVMETAPKTAKPKAKSKPATPKEDK